MDKVILRAALKTLAAIGVLLATMMFALCLIFPSTMMHITYDLGMDGASVNYAMRAYRRAPDINYVAHATETAIGADKDAEIEYCGLKFIEHEDFALYCQSRDAEVEGNGLYKQYIYGNIAVAQYRMGKKHAALNTALSALDANQFPVNNAFFALAITACMEQDGAMLAIINNQIPQLYDGLTQNDKAYLDYLVNLLG